MSFSCIILRFGPYFVEPIICGLHPKTNEPYIASCDLIGCPMEPEDFVVGGTCSEQLYGMIRRHLLKSFYSVLEGV